MTEPRSDEAIRADLATIVGGVSIRGAFGTTQAGRRLLDDVEPLLARAERAEAENARLRKAIRVPTEQATVSEARRRWKPFADVVELAFDDESEIYTAGFIDGSRWAVQR